MRATRVRASERAREKSVVSVMYEPVEEQDLAEPPAQGLKPPPPPPTPPGSERATEEGQAHASAATCPPKKKAGLKRSRGSHQ